MNLWLSNSIYVLTDLYKQIDLSICVIDFMKVYCNYVYEVI